MYINLAQFPFFATSFASQYDRNQSIEKRRELIYKVLYKSCKQYVQSPQSTPFRYDVPRLPTGLNMRYDDWCGNTGYGKFIHKNLWKEYHWLHGNSISSSIISNAYAIRFPISMSPEQVKEKGVKILLRHCKRFIKLYEAQKL